MDSILFGLNQEVVVEVPPMIILLALIRLDYADQHVITGFSDGTWPSGFPNNFGDIVGDIHTSDSADGSRYQLNEWIHPGYRNAAEAQKAGN